MTLGGDGATLHQLRLIGFQEDLHAVDSAHLGSAHLAQIPQQLVMDQHFTQVHDSNVALCRAPELSFGQGR